MDNYVPPGGFEACELCPHVGFCDFISKCQMLATDEEIQAGEEGWEREIEVPLY